MSNWPASSYRYRAAICADNGPLLARYSSVTRASSLSLVIKNLGFNTSGYADDNNATNTFALTFQHNMIAEQLPNLVTQIHEWMNSFFLKMNPDKTEIIMFLPQHLKDVHTINGCIFPDGTCIRFANFVKSLGVMLDKQLNMDVYINSLVSHCFKLLSDIGKIRNLLTSKHRVISSCRYQ